MAQTPKIAFSLDRKTIQATTSWPVRMAESMRLITILTLDTLIVLIKLTE
jgi:hypothetical protein